ncbi:protein KNATM [Ziziphus jujuba]|uniref:Protein KNATM n=2 Tax=Ziziphus jujuba TaxID=326968 RepID=A0A6P3YSI3_ZIZJJ|nr:protein KNATM [Ziziphus jujuba]XP_048318854.1 protein KNATM-like [Ziziphus jujuba var. spinosa]KAH7516258.1 hypothetical protein FEM48_Zijuj10G0116100 [Ziziphus jujuba var. spinosa]
MEDNNSGENSVADTGEEDKQVLKRMISEHPLFGMLIETHINCLKVGLGEVEDQVGITSSPHQYSNTNLLDAATIIPNSSDLDKFMEAYCIALNKLKEAMEKPVKETTSFIKDMYAELKGLTVTSEADEPLVLNDK